MKYPIPCDDDETSIEQYEDVVAHTMNWDFEGVRLGSEQLSDINLDVISEYAKELIPDLILKLGFSSCDSTFDVTKEVNLANIFCEIPGLFEVSEYVDDSPGNSAGWKVFLLEDGADPEIVRKDIEEVYNVLSELEGNANKLEEGQEVCPVCRKVIWPGADDFCEHYLWTVWDGQIMWEITKATELLEQASAFLDLFEDAADKECLKAV